MTSLILFLFGIFVGSFANVIVYRLHQKEHGIITGRSRCPHCKHTLGVLDLIPILSFLFLRGKCRYCHEPISKMYISGELTMGFSFALIGILHPFGFDAAIYPQITLLATYLIIVFVLIIVTFYDILYMEIPDIIMLPAIFLGLIISFVDPTHLLSAGINFFDMESLPLYSFIGGLIPFTFFAIQIIISKGRWMGGGDLRLGAFMGIILGIKLVIVALFAAYLLGAVIGTIAVILQRKKISSQIPFGPFLSIGTLIALFWGEDIVSWYFGMLVY